MTLPLKSFAQFVDDLVAAWGSNVTPLLGAAPTLELGDALYAEFQAVTVQLVFLQALAQQAVNLSRAQTSVGADLDSWMAQFNFARIAAVSATGPITLSRYTPAGQAFQVAAQTSTTQGPIIQTVGGAIQYQIVPDTSQTAWNATDNAYVFPQGATSITVTATALVAGSTSNVTANQLTQLGSTIPNIDYCTNAVAIQNGVNAEADAAFLQRFVYYFNSRSLGVEAAILSAVLGVQQGLTAKVCDFSTAGANIPAGTYEVYVNNGTGSVPSTVITNVSNALASVNGLGITYYVFGPATSNADVSATVYVSDVTQAQAVSAAVTAAVQTFIEDLPIGVNLQYLQLAQVIWNASSYITSVESLTLNGGTTDLTQTYNGVFIPVVTVTVPS